MNRTLMFLALTCCCAAAFGSDVVSARLDLRRFGYRAGGFPSQFSNHSGLTFIPDDLLVISLYQPSFGSVDITNTGSSLSVRFPNPTTESTIVVFDVKRASVTKTDGHGSVPGEADPGSRLSGSRLSG
jgi:hypothetical protein